MGKRSEITLGLRPGEVVVNETSDFLLELLASRATGAWQIHKPEKEALGRRLRLLLSGTHKPVPKKVESVIFQARTAIDDSILLREGDNIDDGRRGLSLEQLFDAARLLDMLRESPVPQLSKIKGAPRSVFFSRTNGWFSPFPDLRAIWTEDELVAVFYGARLGQEFEAWAASFHPSLVRHIDRHWDDIIVVVPAVVPMSRDLLRMLEHERWRIWSNCF